MASRPKRTRVASAGAVAAAALSSASDEETGEDFEDDPPAPASKKRTTRPTKKVIPTPPAVPTATAPATTSGDAAPAVAASDVASGSRRPAKKRRGVGLGLGASLSARALDELGAVVTTGPPPELLAQQPLPAPAPAAAAAAASYAQMLSQHLLASSAAFGAPMATPPPLPGPQAQLAAAQSAAAQFNSPFTVSATAISAAAAAASASGPAGVSMFPLPLPPSLGDSTLLQLQSHTTTTHLTSLQQTQLLGEQSEAKKKQQTAAAAAAGATKSYNRKDKSLGLLCENFLKMYSGGIAKEICLDGAAVALGVERRRIYDIVNILESVDIVSRRGKNQYIWHGTTRLAAAIRVLEQAILSTGLGFQQVDLMGVGQLNAFQQSATQPHQQNMQPPTSQITFGHTGPEYDDDEDGRKAGSRKKKSVVSDSRKEQSLGHLSQVFVQMFLSNDTRIVSLDDAGKWLLGGPVARPGETEAKAQANFKSRVRRLYDIANVFTSLELIEKIHLVQTRKPAFKWLGARVYPLASSVPPEAYTPDAPMRRPNRSAFDAPFPLQPLFTTPVALAATGALPPPIPRRSTIDTAQLPSITAANEALSITTPAPRSGAAPTPSPAHVPDSLLSLHASFEQFEAIKTERVKRAQLDVSATPSSSAAAAAAAAVSVSVKKESQSVSASPSPPSKSLSRTGSFARPIAPTRTPSAAAAHHASVLNLGATARLPASFDPLLLAYARVPPTSTQPAISDEAGPAASSSSYPSAGASAVLSSRAGFDLKSTAYIRDSSEFLSQYRAACAVWQKKMPALKHMFLKHTMAPHAHAHVPSLAAQ